MSRLVSRVSLRPRIRIWPIQRALFHQKMPVYSVADRIKSMLPQVIPGEPVFATETGPSPISIQEISCEQEAETVSQAKRVAQKGDIKHACELILATVPFNQILSVFVDEIVPVLKISTSLDSPQSIPLYNLVLVLQAMGHGPLASQLLMELDADIEQILSDLQLAEILQEVTPNLQIVDEFFWSSTQMHFPQILYNQQVSLWLRAIVMAHVSRGGRAYFETTLQRYGKHFQSNEAMNLILKSNPHAYSSLSSYLLNGEHSNSLAGLIDAIDSSKQLHNLWKKLKPAPDHSVVGHVLRKAIHLNASYTIPSIVRYTSDTNLLTKALVATAWSQKLPPKNDDRALTTAWDVQSEQVTRVVDNLGETVVDQVVAQSVKSISNSESPGRVLWALLLGIEKSKLSKSHSFPAVVVRQFSRALMQRPLLEQLRFMTLDLVTSAGISQLLKSHVSKMIYYRRLHKLPPLSLEQDENVKLMLAGMIVMSEKMSPDHNDGIHLIRVVKELFENWDPKVAAKLVEDLNDRHRPSSEVAMATMGLLLKHGNVALTVQLMRELGPDKLEPPQLHQILVRVGRELPIVIVPLVSWLIRTHKAFIPPSVIRKLIVCLNKTTQMSYSQRFTRTTRLLSILRGLGVGPGAVAAAAMVDAMIKAAEESGRGSRRRLQWALDICQREGVPEEKVKHWLAKVVEMRSSGKGYWAK
ncbi:hypothetical protein B9G98_00936 [Wickerhamiella sorbophila]|uniref:Uncharacterized protein n=1 Tax=Wickerhamiella sorbophila TaxID=45607 RepID=A0A2T0FE92_9ASCO|nr:hypothetical protein B9G98_00936 [Wickerhamiella sorbophila]PRT53316.1 hypothetical protein B9G98_00936 [Wickerhamiella sorbophila]